MSFLDMEWKNWQCTVGQNAKKLPEINARIITVSVQGVESK